MIKGDQIYAGIAQLVEQLIRNQQVAGSSPAAGSNWGNVGFVNFVALLCAYACFFVGVIVEISTKWSLPVLILHFLAKTLHLKIAEETPQVVCFFW